MQKSYKVSNDDNKNKQFTELSKLRVRESDDAPCTADVKLRSKNKKKTKSGLSESGAGFGFSTPVSQTDEIQSLRLLDRVS